jgi:hypothetical protein
MGKGGQFWVGIFSLIQVNMGIYHEWLMKVKNRTGLETIQVNINSSNAGNKIKTSKVNLTSP